ncbi:Pyruvate/2-oxoglutarate dehydrogenase complex dihydrolipoamide dehydrogenase (E3) component [Gaiella occulta]|uniref:Pyruvate/2-oxoglutarate dehydrogenase complex dihydrolipoamide dehydrogenase (E3) component n=1 Tax=Gaiella occulta TaxID=1002870 RepID=A0A7M2YWR1_9ACTN|nr:NAD(P)/FAD-dependent oxidoreductase [Gaiella occulta]RDI74019.1 Pyruvate/2-oxoglutarate dehydrogenase complex dihydrolipoamide dehydrogenase (E3) component [Gaiella occulta]
MSEREVDVVVIGAGPAGEVCAGRLGQAGLEVVLVEHELVGGECSYWGCMPSKALLRPSELLAEARRVPGAREAVQGELDAEAALRRRDEVIHDLDDTAQLPWLEARAVDLVRGTAALDGPRRVRVNGDVLVARRAVVLATGTTAAIPPIPGLNEVAPWTNREGTTAARVPASLIVLGGGAVGVELAQAWTSLGARVTLLETLPRLLAREEPFASELVETALRDRGVDVRLGVQAVMAHREHSRVWITLADGTELAAEELLVAAGRRPQTGSLGLETVGLEPGSFVTVGDDMRVPGHDWLYAIGDVNGRALLTHIGKYQARIAAEQIHGRDARAHRLADGPLVPRVVFSDPQVAAVGHTAESALASGLRIRTVDQQTAATAGASFHGRNTPGISRIVVDEDRDVIVGATFTGTEVAEWLHAATIAIAGEVPTEQLWHAVPSFPTRSEVWLRLLEKLEDERRAATGVSGASHPASA